MDSHNRQQTSESSDDEEDTNFARYMDENGIIGMDEEGLLEIDSTGGPELEDDEEQVLTFDEEGMVEMYKDGVPYPGSPSEDDRSGVPSWQEDFSLSEVAAEERAPNLMETLRNGDGGTSHDTGDHGSLEHPSRSLTLPSALDRPSRDQQLDMTEDEVDRGSSVGAWDGEEDDHWNQTEAELILDRGPVHREDQWDQNPQNEVDYSENPGNEEDQSVTESPSPSSPPVPSTWDTRLMRRVGRLSITPRIENETFPESSYIENRESPDVISNNFSRDSRQARTVRSEPLSPPTRRQHAESSTGKRSKHSTTPLYGRGQLNYPLPDFSKVGPKVRFPRDEEVYRPPQPRRREKLSQRAPVIFKSPAEIVREVLLSSTEKPTQEPVGPPAVPQEFKTPQQATVLVHQLQEDYHKLLTKYAEAENTIDRLRLGAKVHLYSDPPQPSHSIQMGTVSHGAKIMEFSIPHAQAATFSSLNEYQGATEADSLGATEADSQGATEADSDASDHQNPSETSPVHNVPENSGSSSLHPAEDVASSLMSHLETLYREVELFEELLHSGNLTPEEQQQAVRELRGSLDVLERRYLKAQEQQRTGFGNLISELDPQRELEEAIFQLGIQVEELQEQVENSNSSSPNSQLRNNLEDQSTTHHLGNTPVPSASVPIPSLQTPYPQISSPEPPGISKADAETLSKEDPAEYLPQPLLYKHKQVERDYGTLLSTYSSFKSLPDALGVEQEEWPQQLPQNAKPHDRPQDTSSQGHSSAVRSQDVTQNGRTPVPSTPGRPQDAKQDTRQLNHITSVKSEGHEDYLQTDSPRDHHVHRLKRHSRLGSHQGHPVHTTPQTHQPSERSINDLHVAANEASTGSTPSPTKLRKASSILGGQRVSSIEGQPSAVRRMSQGSKTSPQLVSVSSSMPHVREQQSRTAVPYEERAHGPQPHKSSPSAQKKPLRTKESIAQSRILSPETDSGFLGSESSRSPLIQKQKDQLSLTREDPEEVPDSTFNSPIKSKRQSSKSGDHLSRTRKALWDKRKPNNRWSGHSEVSSPSPGPKSLTDSESTEHTDESGSDPDAYNVASANPSPGASQLLSPMEDLTPPRDDILQTRTARDQAIHSLQKEVKQLQKHLENSLRRSPNRGQQGPSAANQNLHEGRSPKLTSDLGSPTSRRGPFVKDSKEGHGLDSFAPRNQDPRSSAAHGGQNIQGPYTGTPYQVSRSPPLPRNEHFTILPCQICQENGRRNSESKKTPKKEKNNPQIAPDCALCRGGSDSDDAPRMGVFTCEYNRRSRRRPRGKHWIMSHMPPVSYVQTPVVHYSPPIVYGTPASFYSPVAYERHRSHSVTPPPSSDLLQLHDLTWPLNRALEAAKELKSTSRRMCRSLTLDLSVQQNFRGSCLF